MTQKVRSEKDPTPCIKGMLRATGLSPHFEIMPTQRPRSSITAPVLVSTLVFQANHMFQTCFAGGARLISIQSSNAQEANTADVIMRTGSHTSWAIDIEVLTADDTGAGCHFPAIIQSKPGIQQIANPIFRAGILARGLSSISCALNRLIDLWSRGALQISSTADYA